MATSGRIDNNAVFIVYVSEDVGVRLESTAAYIGSLLEGCFSGPAHLGPECCFPSFVERDYGVVKSGYPLHRSWFCGESAGTSF